jgi:AhpD family alkylhydroperoxidase
MDEYNAKQYFNQAAHALQTLGKANPEAMSGFQEFMGNVKKDGVLSKKFKELIGIALSIAKQCKFCVAWHVKYALEAGATRDEIIEASMVAGTLGGGPAMMFTSYVLKALDDFQK